LLAAAERLCDVETSGVAVRQGDAFRYIAWRGTLEEGHETILRDRPYTIDRSTAIGRVQMTRDVVHIVDVAADPDYVLKEAGERGWYRTILAVPLLRGGEVAGVIMLPRREVRPFTERQIALIKTFADQAVIAMENARLLGELRESLDQQTATSDVLRTISRSSVELDSVLATLVQTVARLCRADQASLFRRRDELYHLVAAHDLPEEAADFMRTHPPEPDERTLTGRVIKQRQIVHIHDVLQDKNYVYGELQRIQGYRTMLGIPLMVQENMIGLFIVMRTRVDPFTDKEIALAGGFAEQAVIAIENARLFEELRERTDDLTESLEYQTATSEVLKVISRSTFDLQSVLDTLSSTAVRLCLAELSFMTRQEGDEYRFVTAVGSTPQTTRDAIRLKQDFLDRRTFRAGRASITGRVVTEAQVVQIVDIASDPEYALSEINTIGGIRTLLGVPMMREGSVVGTMSLGRQRVEPFTERQIELVRTFADQAVIALENARLLGELRESLDQQTATSDVLRTINRSSVDLAAVLHTLVETVARLCRADHAYMFRREDEFYQLVAAHGLSDEARHAQLLTFLYEGKPRGCCDEPLPSVRQATIGG
jgi:GAF domain-containing protein